MTLTRSWRLVCLAQGEAPPLVPAGLARLPGAQWQARTLDAFLTEVDAGGALPDAVLTFGGEDLIRALRSHDRTCVLPVFLFAAAEQPAPPGFDGSWSGESPEALATVADRTAWSAALPALHAPLDSLRREHRFARWLAARGHCQTSDAEIFGLDAPRSALASWQACGWVEAAPDGVPAWRATAALRVAAAAAALVLPAPPAARPPRSAPAQDAVIAPAAAAPPQWSRSMLLSLSAFLVVLAALLWTGKVDWLGPGLGRDRPAEGARRLRIGDAQLPPAREARGSGASAPAPAGAVGAPGIFVPAVVAPAGDAPRTVARGQVRREPAPLLALSSGRVSALLAAPGARVEAGAPLARLTDPRAERELERLQQELAQVDAAIAAAQSEDAAARALAWEQSELERARLAAQVASAEAARAEAQEHYARSLRLAEDGVLSFREVRPDWEALQRARETEERARGQLDVFLTARAQPAAAGRGEAPAWLGARRARLEDEVQTARALAAPRLVRAAAAGELLEWRVAVGSEVEEGAELARVAAGAAWAEAALDGAESAAGAPRLDEVEVRLTAGSPWTAVSDFEATVAPSGAAMLRARLPAELQESARSGASVELRFRALE